MKTNLPSINKMIKNFDKELKSLLLNDLKISKINLKSTNTLNFSSPNKLKLA